MSGAENPRVLTEKENKQAINLVNFLRNNPIGRHDGVAMIALTPEQIEAERLEKAKREGHELQSEVGGKANTERPTFFSPIEPTRDV